MLVLSLLFQAFIFGEILRTNTISFVLRISVSIFIFLWYILPTTLATIYSYDALASPMYSNVSVSDYEFATTLETIALFLAAFIFAKRSKKHNSHREKNFQAARTNLSIRDAYTYIFLTIYAITLISTFTTTNLNYIDLNDASEYGNRGGNILGPLLTQLLSAFVIFVIVFAPRKSLILYLSFTLLLASSITAVMSGSRIAFLSPMIVLIFRYHDLIKLNLRNLTISICAGIFTVFFVLPVSTSIERLRASGELTISDVVSNLDLSSIKDVSRLIFTKFDSISGGVALVNSGWEVGGGGFTPYYGSALIFIPRRLWADRPVAGSADGTIYGHPSRVVPAAQNIVSDSINVGVSPLHITLWQLGNFGFPFFVIAGIAFFTFLNRLFLSGNSIKTVIAIYLIGLPSFYTLLPSPDVILKQVLMASALILALNFGKSVFNIRKKSIS